MTPERWSEVKRLFEAVLACDAAQRNSFLTEACAGDMALRHEVESLLGWHERTGQLSDLFGVGSLAAGDRLGPYEILSVLGVGGMGQVFKARDTRLNRIVAIKVIRPLVAEGPELRRRFEREALAVASLNHPHICALHDVGTHEGVSFLVMEYLEGETLAERLTRESLDLTEILRYAIQIVEALDAAHCHGVIHRDLKPANILLTSRGAKLLDFGIAKLAAPQEIDATTVEPLTHMGRAPGTLHYMAPEQLEGAPTDARIDIFAFGAVLYEMMTRRKAFNGITPLTPSSVDRVVIRCLARNPADRWPSCQLLLTELQRIAAQIEREPVLARLSQRFITIALPLVLIGSLLFGQWTPRTTPMSVAVLPFINVSEDPELDYLSDGITDGLSNSLSRITGLRVAPKTLVSGYATRRADVEAIARELDVDAVVTGRITKRADTVTVAAELIDVEAFSKLWGAQYRSSSLGVLDVEKAMAAELAGQLRRGLSARDTEGVIKRYTNSPEAHQAYLQGQHYLKMYTADGYKRSITYFEEAIAKDSSFALAYAGLAEAFTAAGYVYVLPATEAYPRAKMAALRALELDDRLAEAHVALANVHFYHEWNYPGAEQRFKVAQALDPTLASAIVGYSIFLASQGRLADAIDEARRAEQLDPVTPATVLTVGWLYYFNGQYDLAMEHLERTLELSPNFITSSYLLAQIVLATGRTIAGMSEIINRYKINPAMARAHIGFVEAVRGSERMKQSYLEALTRFAETGQLPAYGVASVSAALGDHSRAIHWLERAYTLREGFLTWMNVNPDFDAMRDDPRFVDLMRRIGLPNRRSSSR